MSHPVLGRDALHTVHLTLNGRERRGQAQPRLLLSDFLRHELGATGTHVGCEHGVCGACTVRIDGVAARACLTLAVQVDGRRVDTVEAPQGEHPLLDALRAGKHGPDRVAREAIIARLLAKPSLRSRPP